MVAKPAPDDEGDPDELEPESLEIILESDLAHEVIPAQAQPEELSPIANLEPAASDAQAPVPPAPEVAGGETVPEDDDPASNTQKLERPTFPEQPEAAAPHPPPTQTPTKRAATGMGVIVFSGENEVLETVQKAVRGRIPVYQATNVVQVVKIFRSVYRKF